MQLVCQTTKYPNKNIILIVFHSGTDNNNFSLYFVFPSTSDSQLGHYDTEKKDYPPFVSF
jgi:hypothetical protein